MDKNTRPLLLIGFIFLVALGFQVFTNYIPSIIETTQEKETTKKAETIQEELKNKLQTALDKYIEKAEQQIAKDEEKETTSKNIVSKRTPKFFSDFVTYKDNKPEESTFSLDDYSEILSGEEPVKGLESKTLVLKITDPKTNKEEIVVLLLNSVFITQAKF